ncbi:two-component system, sensor histidine kinase YesM [Bacillus sp. OV166]|uniref:cache domain-containing sensor histidine kinase n=1 Tax=Bacillus sp. OV166 TaxID=1882763 RepID=UPI000A2AD4F8|nr:sensor histidine kinase [Bacillus sp. OV166]SMQ63454.1 two-component system, sensor histidine kinase YesM [Bacillus sp. OV166]
MISKLQEAIKFKDFRLTTKLIITYILLTVIPMALLGYIAYYQNTKSIEEQVGEYVPRLLMQANENIENEINDLENLPELVYSSNDVMAVLRGDTYKSQSALLQDQFIVKNFLSGTYLNSNHSEILGAFVLSKNRLFASSRTTYKGLDFKNASLPYGEDFDLGGNMQILLPNQINLTFQGNPPYLLLVKQIIDFDNRKNLGTLFLAVKVTFIEKILKDLDHEANATMWMMNKHGQVIYHTDSSKIGTMFKEINEYPLLNGSFRTNVNGKPTLISVSETKNLDWVLVHSIPLKYLTERADIVRNVTMLIFIIFAVITTVISIILAWTVTRPINTLGRLMKEVEKGNFQVDIPIHSKDEVGMLARSFHSMITKIRELIQKNYHIELRQKNAELYALQSQINPHFMYNTLETIGMAVEEGESEMVVDMVTLLGRMLRFSLSNKDRLVPISKEVQHIRDYLAIQSFRFEERLSFHIPEIVDDDYYYTPKFVLQPIVENAIRYGLEKRKGIEIHIDVIKERNEAGQEDILLVIRDNGPGIHKETLEKLNLLLQSDPMVKRDSGFGIINVHARVAMMFGNDYGLRIHSVIEEGTEVVIRIPMIGENQVAQYANGKEHILDNDND